MGESFYPPAVAAKVTEVSEEMQRSIRSRFGATWENEIGVNRNGRWYFAEADLIALSSFDMHLANGTSPNLASHYASLLRQALEEKPETDVATITVGWPGDRSAAPQEVRFEPLARTAVSYEHFHMVINVAALRKYVRDGLARIEAAAAEG